MGSTELPYTNDACHCKDIKNKTVLLIEVGWYARIYKRMSVVFPFYCSKLFQSRVPYLLILYSLSHHPILYSLFPYTAISHAQ